MARTTAPRTSYTRDIDNLRRFKEGLNQDPLIDDATKNALSAACEMIHMAMGVYEDEEYRKKVIETKAKKIYDIVFPPEKKSA